MWEELLQGCGLWQFGSWEDGSARRGAGERGAGAARRPIFRAPGKGPAFQIWVHGRGHSLPTGPVRPWSAGQATHGEWVGTPASPSPSNTQEAPLCTGPARVPGWQRPALSPGRAEGAWGRVLGPWNHRGCHCLWEETQGDPRAPRQLPSPVSCPPSGCDSAWSSSPRGWSRREVRTGANYLEEGERDRCRVGNSSPRWENTGLWMSFQKMWAARGHLVEACRW